MRFYRAGHSPSVLPFRSSAVNTMISPTDALIVPTPPPGHPAGGGDISQADVMATLRRKDLVTAPTLRRIKCHLVWNRCTNFLSVRSMMYEKSLDA